jgi:hypothetical protein
MDDMDDAEQWKRSSLFLAAALLVIIFVTILLLGVELAREQSEQHAREVQAEATLIACAWNCQPYDGVIAQDGRCFCRDSFMRVVRQGILR